MKCNLIAWVSSGNEPRIYRSPTRRNQSITYEDRLQRAIDSKEITSTQPDILSREDGVWVVPWGEHVKEYPNKDALMVALALKGIDVSELEKVNVVDINE